MRSSSSPYRPPGSEDEDEHEHEHDTEDDTEHEDDTEDEISLSIGDRIL